MNDARDGLICVRLRCREHRPTRFTREQPLPHLRALSCITKETSLPDEPSTNSDLRVFKKQRVDMFSGQIQFAEQLAVLEAETVGGDDGHEGACPGIGSRRQVSPQLSLR